MPARAAGKTSESQAPRLVVVGGFLGAGKTSLLVAAARRIRESGGRVALITNDQGTGLVDTQLASAAGFAVREVTGGCFCCRFSDLVRAAAGLLEFGPEVILAEPVGSCIDLAGTVIRPLGTLYASQIDVAPLTVLVDPATARMLAAEEADPRLAYLWRRQIDEADILCTSKADLGQPLGGLGRPVDYQLSARTGQGISEWLAEVLSGSRPAGSRLLEVDYQAYADAEAALGWLNWRGEVRLRRAASPAHVLGPVLEEMDRRLTEAGAVIAHLKGLAVAGRGWVKASICANRDEPDIEGDLMAAPSRRHTLTLNLRARAAPPLLEAALRYALALLRGDVHELAFECFQPAPPKPEQRMA
jgi:hypothetical protein